MVFINIYADSCGSRECDTEFLAVNKVNGIRCALCGDTASARLTRQHNDANMLALGAGMTGPVLALEIVDTFLNTAFEGGRHQRRVDKIMEAEKD